MGEFEEVGMLPGTPDGFERLWTPPRMLYISGENKPPTPAFQTTARSAPSSPVMTARD